MFLPQQRKPCCALTVARGADFRKPANGFAAGLNVLKRRHGDKKSKIP
jgi:hypothetical protein